MIVFDKNLFKNKTIIVTGASSGIGKDLSVQLSFLGATVICLGRNSERLNKTLLALKKNNHHKYVVDLSNTEKAYAAFMQVRENFQSIDGIFHGAGEELLKLSRLIKNKDIDKVFGASVFGALGLSKAAQTKDYFSKQGGSIVFLSSVASQKGQFGMTSYGSSRSAILGLTKNLAIELGIKKIRVNAIIAGAIKTEMHFRIIKSLTQKSIKDYEDKHVFGFGEPKDISNAAIFLLSEAGKWITGSDLLIDGGYMVK